MSRVRAVRGTQVTLRNHTADLRWKAWVGREGPPVPVIIEPSVWQELVVAALTSQPPIHVPRVYRLFMPRGEPRRVAALSEIVRVWATERGVTRWEEEGYPSRAARQRKGGNAFIQDRTELGLRDAWWMGREQTDLRLFLSPHSAELEVAAWWGRGGTVGLRGQETDGDLWPVELLLETDTPPE